MMLRLLSFLLLPSVLLADLHTPENPWGEYAPTCLADEPSLWDDSRIEQKWYTIDLDAEAHDRWREVMNDYLPGMLAVVDLMKGLITDFGGDGAWDNLLDLMSSVPDKLPEPYRTEIHALADLTQQPIEEFALLNIFYELEAACTSLVAMDEKGNTFHGRNLDFGLWMQWNKDLHTWELTKRLQDIVAQFRFVKDGKLLFKGVGFAGHLGLLTAVRPGAFSVSINTRFGSALDTMTNFFLNGLEPNQEFELYVLRDMMTNCSTFEEARKYMETVQLLAQGYFTIGATDGGVVVTRGLTTFDHEAVIDPKEKNGWYVLQTNYDWDKPDIIFDDRTKPGKRCMEQLGRKRVSKEGIFQVMSSKQNLNKSTIYTIIMNVKTGDLYTFKQQCPDPCWLV